MDLRRAQREMAEIARSIYGPDEAEPGFAGEKPFSPLAEAIRDWLEKNPSDACQPPGWFSTTMWAYKRVPFRPTPQDGRAAIEELGGERYLRRYLERQRSRHA